MLLPRSWESFSSALVFLFMKDILLVYTAPLSVHKIPVNTRGSDLLISGDDVGYGIIIDAGSSGSRLFVYTYGMSRSSEHQIPRIQILKDRNNVEVIKKVNPGLSSFVNNLSAVDNYISSLLDFAKINIPTGYQEQTNLYIMATAGMRLLSDTEQESIWERVRTVIKNKYVFSFKDSDARTISGKEEALFGWITVNYLLDSFGFDWTLNSQLPTHGMLDMGGASMQISYELGPEEIAPWDLIAEFHVQFSKTGRKLFYRVYVVSYLNYGANVARSRYEEFLLYNYAKNNRPDPNQPVHLDDSCLFKGLVIGSPSVVPRAANDFRQPEKTEPKFNVTFTGRGMYDNCMETVKPLLNKHFDCKPYPCAVGDVLQPPIDFDDMDFYGMSNFYYGLHPLMNGSRYDHTFVSAKAQGLCAKNWQKYEDEIRRQNAGKPKDEVDKIVELQKQACFKASYVISMLHDGLLFPKHYSRLHIVTQLRNTELQWSLGALFYMLYATPAQDWPPYLIAITVVLSIVLLALVIIIIILAIYICLRRKADDESVDVVDRSPTPVPITVISYRESTSESNYSCPQKHI